MEFIQDNSLTVPWMDLSLQQWPEGDETAIRDFAAELESTAHGARLQWIRDKKARLLHKFAPQLEQATIAEL